MSNRISDIIISVLASDAFTLKAEWIYELEKVDAIIEATKDELADHPEDGFHKGKKAGELTHYGDHTRNLLRYLAEARSFSLDSYARQWVSFFDTYTGYQDMASKNALKRLKKDPSALLAPKKALADTAGAARFIPLLLVADRDQEKLRIMAQKEVGLFYNSPFIRDIIDLAVYLTFKGLDGTHPYDALQAKDAPISELIAPLIQTGLDSVTQDTREVIQKFGNACGADAGLPIAAHLIAKYKNTPETAQLENLRGGGDSAGRALLYTSIVAPYFGRACVLQKWIDGMQNLSSIQSDSTDLSES